MKTLTSETKAEFSCCITVAVANDPQILYAGVYILISLTTRRSVSLHYFYFQHSFSLFFSVSSTPWTRLLYLYYTVSQKNVHLWLAITFEACERILVFFAEVLPIK